MGAWRGRGRKGWHGRGRRGGRGRGADGEGGGYSKMSEGEQAEGGGGPALEVEVGESCVERYLGNTMRRFRASESEAAVPMELEH